MRIGNKYILSEGTLLKKSFIRNLNRIITEELSVSVAVLKESGRLTARIYGVIENKSHRFKPIKKGISAFAFDIADYILFNQTFTISVNCINFSDKKTLSDNEEKYNIGLAFLDTVKNIIIVNIGFISGSIVTDVQTQLQHEIHHKYQELKSGKRINDYHLSDKGRVVYNNACKVIQSGERSGLLYQLSWILYCLSPHEIEASADELYTELKNSEKTFEETLNGSQMYQKYVMCQKFVRDIKKRRGTQELNNCIVSLGVDQLGGEKWLFNFMDIQLKRMINKIGKVRTAYCDDVFD